VAPRPLIDDFPVRWRLHPSSRADPFSAPSFPQRFLSLEFPFLLFPIFFRRTARVIPFRSGLHVFCFHGSSPERMGPSHRADASLRLHAPCSSLSLVPKENGAERKVKENVLSRVTLGGAPVKLTSHEFRVLSYFRWMVLSDHARNSDLLDVQ
jgi:hypothetical protein